MTYKALSEPENVTRFLPEEERSHTLSFDYHSGDKLLHGQLLK